MKVLDHHKKRGSRVPLNPSNAQLVAEAIKSLKDKQCNLNYSDFVNEVLEIFFKKYMTLNQKRFETRFFDRRKFLKKALDSNSEKDFDESLKTLFQKISAPQKKQKKLEI